MKKFLKHLVVLILGWQVNRLRKSNSFKTIAVVGSVGKTSTKLTIAKLLSEHEKVNFQEGNYNDIVSVPLVFFDKKIPSLINPFAWLALLLQNEIYLRRLYPYDIIVLELGTDGPGQLIEFKKYLEVDLLIVTAIAEEHMEFFDSLDEVAAEELSAQAFSKQVLINADLCDQKYSSMYKPGYLTYSIHANSDYKITINDFDGRTFDYSFLKHGENVLDSKYTGISEVELYSVGAALSTADHLQYTIAEFSTISSMQPFSGRMQRLAGINGSLIIDDTYNASPAATKTAIKALYDQKAAQKIAILGSMNELGQHSENAHRQVGQMCNPSQLDYVVTIGTESNKFIAEEAEKTGCKVERFTDPTEAGQFVKKILKPNAVVLAKGSQNGVFAEESIKPLLANSDDSAKLVRQSPEWLQKKGKAFSQLTTKADK